MIAIKPAVRSPAPPRIRIFAPPGGEISLNRVPYDRSFPEGIAIIAHVDKDIRAAIAARIMVVFDIVSHELEVAHRSTIQPNPGCGVVADMGIGHNRLMEVDMVEENSRFVVVIDLAVINEEIPVPFHEMNGGFYTFGSLHRSESPALFFADKIPADSGCSPRISQTADEGHSFLVPYAIIETDGIGGAFVRTEKMKRGTRAGHFDPRRTITE